MLALILYMFNNELLLFVNNLDLEHLLSLVY